MSLNKLIKEENSELWWNYCGNIFRNRMEVDNHIFEACKPIFSAKEPQWKEIEVCVTCNQTIAKKSWLTKHIQETLTKLLQNYCGKMFK